MIEGIALALMKTLATYLFKNYVLAQTNIHIEGAPKWYMQNNPYQVCVYDFQHGGMEAVEKAKDATHPKMKEEISSILESVIYNNYSDLKDPKEKKFVMMFKDDPEADIFINANMKFPNIEYLKKEQTAFVQGCIDKKIIIGYQEKRVDKIKYELTHHRADSAFDELETETAQ